MSPETDLALQVLIRVMTWVLVWLAGLLAVGTVMASVILTMFFTKPPRKTSTRVDNRS